MLLRTIKKKTTKSSITQRTESNYRCKISLRKKWLLFLWSILLQSCSGESTTSEVKGVTLDPAAETENTAATSYDRTLVSTMGSNRATGYMTSNKILELDNGYLITYLESDGATVEVILEHYDYDHNQLSRVNIGKAENNHGGAAITIDREGYLHIVYGPHTTPMRHRRSTSPNQYVEFTDEIEFGEALTYPSILMNENNELIVAAREGTGSEDTSGSIEIWKMSSDRVFTKISSPVVNREKGYAAFNPSIAIDSQNRIHLVALVHEGTDDEGYGLYQALIYLVSNNGGYTWENSKGKRLESYADVEEIGPFYEGGVRSNAVIGSGVVAISSADSVLVNFSTQATDELASGFYIGELRDSNWEFIRVGNDQGFFDGRYRVSDPGVIVAIEDGSVYFALGLQDIILADIDPWVGVA